MTAASHAELWPRLAEEFGTPFWLYDAGVMRGRIRDVLTMTEPEGIQARFAMKSCPATRVLREMRSHGLWLDTVSGNEVLRGLRAGFPAGRRPPCVFLTCDVFRDNALDVALEHDILINIGSPGMLDDLAERGFRGPVSIRVNPGFGHGHVNACDTGGPSSKHGVWISDVPALGARARSLGIPVTMLHAHIGSGPRFQELVDNLARLTTEMAALIPACPDIEAVSLGGGIPHDYRGGEQPVDPVALRDLFRRAKDRFEEAAGRALRVEIEPGRFLTAPAATLVTRVHDVKETQSNEKGDKARFAMVDAGFTDLLRPAMYGAYHRISLADATGRPTGPHVVAGPLCESGDVFTRDSGEMLVPRNLPVPRRGDLLGLHDAGAYGYAMSSNYNSLGRAPQIWIDEDGTIELMSRRETVDDIIATEVP